MLYIPDVNMMSNTTTQIYWQVEHTLNPLNQTKLKDNDKNRAKEQQQLKVQINKSTNWGCAVNSSKYKKVISWFIVHRFLCIHVVKMQYSD